MKTIYTFLGSEQDMDVFIQHYEMQSRVILPAQSRREFTPRDERKCRYCKRSSKDTTFKKEAHIIPELLGNKNLVSDFECDNCNDLFSKYESELSAFLGILRTVFGTKTKRNKIPKFTSNDKSLIASSNNIEDEVDKAILISDKTGKNIQINAKSGETRINFDINYIPIQVYKAFLKIALGLIKNEDIEKYQVAYDFLINDNLNNQIGKVASILQYSYPLNQKLHCYLFKKKDNDDRLPTHIFQLYYENKMFQFFIPFNLDDSEIYNGKPCTPIWCPPILQSEPTKIKSLDKRFIELSKTERITEKPLVTLHFESEEIIKSQILDSKKRSFIDDFEMNSESSTEILLVRIDPKRTNKTS